MKKRVKSKISKKPIKEIKRQEHYTITNTFGNIQKMVFPSNVQVGLNHEQFNSTISGSIHLTHQGISYLVAGTNIQILSSSNGQVTISATAGAEGSAGPATPSATFTRSIVPVITDDTGGALDDGGDLSDGDISEQAFTKIDVNSGTTNVTFAGHNESGNPTNNTYKIVTDSITAFTDNGTELTEANSASEGDSSYNVTFANSGTRLTLALSADSSDAKLKVSSLAEHEDGSNTDFNSVLVNVPIKMTTAAGTQTMTRSFTVQKIKKGSTGNTGSNGDDGNDGAAGSGVVVTLDPMSVTLPASSDGTVSSYTASGATIKVHENGTAINIDTSLSSNSRWFVVSATGANITAGGISQTNGQNSATIADALSISATTATIAHVVRVKNSLGVTSDYTLTQTLTKAIAGTNGTDGTSSVAIFGINSSSAEVPISHGTDTSQFIVPYDTTILANAGVASNSSGELTLAATGTYSITVSIKATEQHDGGDTNNKYTLTLALDDGAGSYTTLPYEDKIQPGGNNKTANLLISNAIVAVSSGGTKKIKSQIQKSDSNNNFVHVDTSSQRLATIRVEKLS